jgi:hypothetical protein
VRAMPTERAHQAMALATILRSQGIGESGAAT